MDFNQLHGEVSEAEGLLAGTKVPIFAVLESQMGDPVLSHWIGPDGVVAGTALGRVSAYLFDRSLVLASTVAGRFDTGTTNIQEGLKPDEHAPNRPCDVFHPDFAPSDEPATNVDESSTFPKDNPNIGAGVAMEPRDQGSDSVRIGITYDTDDDVGNDECHKECMEGRFKQIATLCFTLMNYIKCGGGLQVKRNISEVLPGRYTVFASFSDEAVRAVFIHGRMLYCMIGTSAIAVYDIDQYMLKNEYRLSLSRNAGYKQIIFANCKILVDCMRGSTILDPVEKKQISSTHRVYPSNVLDFNGSEMMCYYRNINKYFVQVVSLHSDSAKKVVFSIAMPKSVYLVTHGKFWNHDKIVVVADMTSISVFKYLELTVPVARRRMNVDIVAVCGEFKNFLAVITKDSTLRLLHEHTLDTFFKLSLYPATFELGWPYTLVSHKNILSFTSDEGVYCFKMPRKVLRVASKWHRHPTVEIAAAETNDETSSI